MGKTIVEKNLNQAGGVDSSAGDIVTVGLSYLMTNDAVAELTIQAFEKLGKSPWDKDRIVIVLDHHIPATTENAVRNHKMLRDFAGKHGLRLFDHQGICHQLMLEQFVLPGDVVIGTDPHTCTYGGIGAFAASVGSTDGAVAMAAGKIWLKIPETIRIELKGALSDHVLPKDVILKIIRELGADGAIYKVLQFKGNGTAGIGNAGRFTICNMAIEAGAKTGIFEPDRITEYFIKQRKPKGVFFQGDPDAEYSMNMTVDFDRLSPQISCRWSVDQVVPVAEVAGIRIDQAFIGSCTNGRIEDLRLVAQTLKGRQIHPRGRLLVTPASQNIYCQAVTEGLIEALIDAGAVICNPGCSPCFGGQRMLWEGEVCIGTHNRNFRARMGHKDAKVYLVSPETIAVSAIAGAIKNPCQ